MASGLGRRPGAPRGRRAAVLGAATGISWGFMAAVIKELSSHLGGGPGAVFSAWSLYLLIAAGAVTMLLASHALAAGPLAASQPGFTILDPLTASLLGVFLFGEHIRTDAAALAGEALALAVVIAGAAALSRSSLIAGENAPAVPPAPGRPKQRRQRIPGHPPAGGSGGPARTWQLPDQAAGGAQPGRGGPRRPDASRSRPRRGPGRTTQAGPGKSRP